MESSKRAKAPGSNVTHCLADGCSADLSLCRDYHRRHKVCEIHSKTPKVTIGGREQRFCQQCSRFHSLVEFDEGKRSCRKRLDGHNRRRRKPPPPPPQPDRLVFSTQPRLPPTGRLLSFGSSPHEILATSSILTSSWTGAIKSEEALYNNHHQPINYNSSSSFPEQSINQLHFQFIHTNNDDYMDGRKMFAADGLVDSSDRALSLLSPPAPHPVHNYFQSCHQYQLEDDQESSKANLVDDVSSVPRMMFQSGDQGPSSTAGPHHQTLTFMWE